MHNNNSIYCNAMINSIANINALLVDIKTVNTGLPRALQLAGFDTSRPLGMEQEYTVSSLINTIDTLAIQFLTITANRNQFIQRTSFNERLQIESCLRNLFICLKQTSNTLQSLDSGDYQVVDNEALSYINEQKPITRLVLCRAIEYVDQLKPYSRMLELVIAQERIHALSAVLETLLQKETAPSQLSHEEDHELTEEQHNALELSHYLIKQAL